MAILVGIVYLGMPPPTARADFQLKIYDDGVQQGSTYILTAPSTTLTNINTSNFTITSLTLTDNHGGISITNISVLETSNSTSNDLKFVLSANNITTPAGPGSGTVQSSSSYVATSMTSGGTLSYTGYYDSSNTLFNQATSTGTQTLTVASSGATTSGSSTTSAISVSIPGSPGYALTSITDILFNAGNVTDNAQMQTNGSTVVTAVTTPAPGSVILAASAFPMLLGGWFLRRRKLALLA
jgi:hypothetical protein